MVPKGVGEKGAAWREEVFRLLRKPPCSQTADERADVVEKIHKKENEDEFTEAEFRSGMKIQFSKMFRTDAARKTIARASARGRRGFRGGDDKNAENNCAGDFTRHENCGEKKSPRRRGARGIGKFPRPTKVADWRR